jgi:hypothetical protein
MLGNWESCTCNLRIIVNYLDAKVAFHRLELEHNHESATSIIHLLKVRPFRTAISHTQADSADLLQLA